MKARRFALRNLLASLGVVFATSVTYALVVPALLGLEDAARLALVVAASVVSLATSLLVSLPPLRDLPVFARVGHAVTAGSALDPRDRARLYAAPRNAVALLLVAAVGTFSLGSVRLGAAANGRPRR